LATSKVRRLAAGDLSLSFGAIALPLHVWAILNILAIVPAWLLRASLWELAGVISYPLVDALLESAILWIVLVGISFILPRRWLADRFVALSGIIVWILAAWAVLVQFIYGDLLQWSTGAILAGMLLVLVSLGLVYWLVHRSPRLEGWIKKGFQGLSVLTYVYMAFDVLGLVVIVLRNI